MDAIRIGFKTSSRRVVAIWKRWAELCNSLALMWFMMSNGAACPHWWASYLACSTCPISWKPHPRRARKAMNELEGGVFPSLEVQLSKLGAIFEKPNSPPREEGTLLDQNDTSRV